MNGLVAWEAHSGPLPPAQEFAGYERALPGAAERILKMAELQQQRQIDADKAADDRDKAVVDAQVTIAKRAQLTTTLIVLSLVALVAFALSLGQELAGAASALAAVATIIYALNGGQFRRSRSGDTDTATADRKDGPRD